MKGRAKRWQGVECPSKPKTVGTPNKILIHGVFIFSSYFDNCLYLLLFNKQYQIPIENSNC